MQDISGTSAKNTTPPDTTKETEGHGKDAEKGVEQESQQDLGTKGLDAQGTDSLRGTKQTSDPIKVQ